MRKTSERRKCNIRKCNIYCWGITVFRPIAAEVLAKEISFDILGALREAGARGMTVKEIREEFRLTPRNVKPARFKYPRSTIYRALNSLEQIGWISSGRATLKWGRPSLEETKRKGRDKPRGGRPFKVYRSEVEDSPRILVDSDFSEALEPVLDKFISELKKIWIETMKKVISEFESGPLRKFFPADEIREDGFNHEWLEFMWVVTNMMNDYLQGDDEWGDFLLSKGLIDERARKDYYG